MFHSKPLEKDSKVALVIRRLRSLYAGFNKKYDGWDAEQKRDYIMQLESVNDLPTFVVHSGLKHIQSTQDGNYEPSIQKILSVFTSSKPVFEVKKKYVPDSNLEAQYASALSDAASHDKTKSKQGWAKVQELRIKMTQHQQQWVKSA